MSVRRERPTTGRTAVRVASFGDPSALGAYPVEPARLVAAELLQPLDPNPDRAVGGTRRRPDLPDLPLPGLPGLSIRVKFDRFVRSGGFASSGGFGGFEGLVV